MSTLAELIKQKEALEAQIDQVRQNELSDAISKIKAIIAEYHLTADDIFGGAKRARKVSTESKVMPKYRDPATGLTWSGRGRTPKWMEGKDRAQFEI